MTWAGTEVNELLSRPAIAAGANVLLSAQRGTVEPPRVNRRAQTVPRNRFSSRPAIAARADVLLSWQRDVAEPRRADGSAEPRALRGVVGGSAEPS
jgi:hypothetical protein